MKTFITIPKALILTLGLLLLAGCDDNPAESEDNVDISGTYEWSEITRLELHESLVTEFFGIEPEGTMTTLTCPSWGSLTITQNGSTFTGEGTQSAACTTEGGQAVVPMAFPPSLSLVDGVIEDQQFRFTFDTGVFPCLYEGVIQHEGGTLNLVGSGHCEPPFPPELSRDEIFHFIATRL